MSGTIAEDASSKLPVDVRSESLVDMKHLVTPWSQASTAPSTPSCMALPDPCVEVDGGKFTFLRQCSGASTHIPDDADGGKPAFLRQWSGNSADDGWTTDLALDEIDAMERGMVVTSPSFKVPCLQSDLAKHALEKVVEEQKYEYKDGVQWLVSRGSPPSLSDLEEKLDEVKALYKEKTGLDVDSEGEEDVEEQQYEYKDGVKWCVSRGSPPSLSALEEKLEEVKALYKQKTGLDVDSEDEEEQQYEYKGGIQWLVSRGSPPSLPALEEKLEEVKALYKQKTGLDVDSEDDELQVDEQQYEYKDGVKWLVSRGSPPSLSALEEKLEEVKALYKEKTGLDVDSEGEEQQYEYKDGMRWYVSRGRSPPSFAVLEGKLEEVKALYKTNTGRDVDSESDVESEAQA